MSELPQPTEDLAQVKTQLDTCGYGLLANALNAEELSKIKTRLEEQAIAEKQRGLAFEDGGAKQNWGDFRNKNGHVRAGAFTQSARGVNQRVWMLINKGRVFQDMLLHTGVRNIVDHALGAITICYRAIRPTSPNLAAFPCACTQTSGGCPCQRTPEPNASTRRLYHPRANR